MTMWQKQTNYLLLFFLFLFFQLPITAVANEDDLGKGNMEIKTDRIMQGESTEEQNQETELDRVFPELFTSEVKEQLDEQQQLSQRQYAELKDSLFTTHVKETSIYDMKSELFVEASDISHEVSQEEIDKTNTSESGSISTIIFYTSVALFVGVLISIVLFIIRKLRF